MASKYQKRQYEGIAEVLNTWAGTIEKDGKAYYYTHLHLCNDFAIMFAADNPLFDRERFLNACGLDN